MSDLFDTTLSSLMDSDYYDSILMDENQESYDYMLRYSAAEGDIENVISMIEKGAEICSMNYYPFRYSIYNGHLNIVQYFMDYNKFPDVTKYFHNHKLDFIDVCINERYFDILHYFITNNLYIIESDILIKKNKEIINIIIKENIGHLPLIYDIMKSFVELYKNKENTNTANPNQLMELPIQNRDLKKLLYICIENNNIDVLNVFKYIITNFKQYLDNELYSDVLRYALVFDLKEIIRFILQNQNDDTFFEFMTTEHKHIYETIINSSNDDVEFIKYLYSKGLDIHAYNEYLFICAIRNGFYNIIKYLIDDHDVNIHIDEDYPLREACMYGDIEIVKILVSKGADIYADDDFPIRISAEYCNFELFKFLIEKCDAYVHTMQEYALRMSAKNGSYDIVEYILTKCESVDVHAENDYALRYSAENGHYKIVKLLIDYGANVNAENDYAIRHASDYGFYKTVKILIENGANVHADDEYPIRMSATYGHLNIVKLLIENGADLHVDNDWILFECAKIGYRSIVKYLVEKGANINVLPLHLRKKYELSINLWKKCEVFVDWRNSNVCPISQEEFKENEEKLGCIECRNVFKKEELEKWLNSDTESIKSCPMCRKYTDYYIV